LTSGPSSGRFRPARSRLHPLFDGYAAAENRGTLALAYALTPSHSPGLLSEFSRAFLNRAFPIHRGDRVDERLQLVLPSDSRGTKAIPDAAFVNHTHRRLLLIESKVETGAIDVVQLRRHLVNAKRHFPGYRMVLLLVTPDPRDTSAAPLGRLSRQFDARVVPLQWFEIHEWAWKHLRRVAAGRVPMTSTFLLQQLIRFLRGRDWMGFQGFPDDWPEEYRISEAREHLKALREHFRQARHWPSRLMPTGKRLTQPWFSLGDSQVHLTVYAWQDWTGLDLYVPRTVARHRLKSDEDWTAFLSKIRALPDREHVWVKTSRWRLINWKKGQQTGPTMDSILLSVSAQDLLRTSKGRVLIEPLRRLSCRWFNGAARGRSRS
jgi:hypothetical protein